LPEEKYNETALSLIGGCVQKKMFSL